MTLTCSCDSDDLLANRIYGNGRQFKFTSDSSYQNIGRIRWAGPLHPVFLVGFGAGYGQADCFARLNFVGLADCLVCKGKGHK